MYLTLICCSFTNKIKNKLSPPYNGVFATFTAPNLRYVVTVSFAWSEIPGSNSEVVMRIEGFHPKINHSVK